MLERLRNIREDGEGGFTLIELLIVIVILGVLAAIVVFAVGSSTSDSKLAACQSDKKAIEVGLEAYKARAGVYPTAAATDLIGTTNGGPYLKAWPGNSNYNFTVTTLTSTITTTNGTGGAAFPTGC